MRRAARIDKAQAGIVATLRQAGCSVQILSAVGKGCPDLLVGRAQSNILLEIKTPGSPSAEALTPDEAKWHAGWQGQVAIVKTAEDALRAVGLL